jgi:glutaredoxin
MKKLILTSFILISGICPAQLLLQDFALTNVVDGKVTSPGNFSNRRVLVIIFTSNDCPYDAYYRDRIRSMVKDYAQSVQFLLVNANQEPNESVKKMKEGYGQWQLPVPYLADKDQVLMTQLHASKTPEAFVFRNDKGKFSKVYQGALDDNPQIATDVGTSYLKESIDQLLAGTKITNGSVRAVGCFIRGK